MGPTRPLRTLGVPLLSLLLALSLMMPLQSVMAHTGGGDDPGDDKDRPDIGQPEVTVKKNDNFVKIMTEVEDDETGTIDESEFKVRVVNGFMIELRNRHRAERVDTEVWMELTFRCLIGLGEKDDAKDVDCSKENRNTRQFGEMEFNRPEYKECKDCKEYKHRIQVSTKDGKFYAYFDTMGGFQEGDDGARVPEPITLELKMKYFEFRQEDTRLALVMDIETNARTVVKDSEGGTEDGSRRVDGELGDTILTIDDTASINDKDEEVSIEYTSLDEGDSEVVVDYPRGDKIYHTIEVGIVPSLVTLKGSLPLYRASLAGVAALVILTDRRVLGRLRKK